MNIERISVQLSSAHYAAQLMQLNSGSSAPAAQLLQLSSCSSAHAAQLMQLSSCSSARRYAFWSALRRDKRV